MHAGYVRRPPGGAEEIGLGLGLGLGQWIWTWHWIWTLDLDVHFGDGLWIRLLWAIHFGHVSNYIVRWDGRWDLGRVG